MSDDNPPAEMGLCVFLLMFGDLCSLNGLEHYEITGPFEPDSPNLMERIICHN